MRFILSVVLIALVLVLDQWTKWQVFEHLLRPDAVNSSFSDWLITVKPFMTFIDQANDLRSVTLTSWFSLVMVWNQGVSFGFLGGAEPLSPFALIGLSMVIGLGVIVWMARTVRPLVLWGGSFVLGGAVANILDRLRFGAVADFVDWHVGEYHWPAFNLADCCIVVGAALMMLDSIRHEGKKQEKEEV